MLNAQPALKKWGVGSPAKVPLEQMITERGKYVGSKRMKLSPAYPIIEGFKGSPALGYLVHFEDPMQFNQLTATLSYSPFYKRQEQRPAARLDRI